MYLCNRKSNNNTNNLRYKVMKKASLKNVRSEFKNQSGSINFCLKVIYSAIEQAKEDNKEIKELKKVMPKSKNEAYKLASEIASFGRVGQTKTIHRVIKACETDITYTIKPSVDMILKYFTKKANGEI